MMLKHIHRSTNWMLNAWMHFGQVRVINNVKKLQEVKPNFQEAFKQDGYPSTLPYQQKVC